MSVYLPTSVEAGVTLIARLRGEEKRVVFTNGVYDLLHPGHIRTSGGPCAG